MIGCLEEIAYRKGFIDKKLLMGNIKVLGPDYGKYLEKIANEPE
ncbi:MAG: hypothetical protein PHR82_07145 [Endomicrobiaceae bacterium]|nr:hypothetical protein [Endomicrobiaceae bacterium]